MEDRNAMGGVLCLYRSSTIGMHAFEEAGQMKSKRDPGRTCQGRKTINR